MHNQETHLRFIDLRSQQISLEQIAAQIGVSKPTLVRWDKRFRNQIWQLRSDREWEWNSRVRTADEELARLAAHLQRVDVALTDASMRELPPEKLVRLSCLLRAEMRHERERKEQCRGHDLPPDDTHSSTPQAEPPTSEA